jgi:ketosteroid isomerase-like protein
MMKVEAPPAGDRIKQLLDAWEIERIWTHYFDRVDADDAAGAVRDFAPDVRVEIMTGKVYEGRDAYARALDRVLAQYERTSHHASNFDIEFQDRNNATMTAYVYAFHRLRETGEPWHLWARIVDRLERRNGLGWVVTEHVLHGVDSDPRWGKIDDSWYRGHPGRRDRTETGR